MKQSTFFILCGVIALGSLAVGIIGAIHDERKDKKHKPAATLLDLYDDNAAFEPSLFDDSPGEPGFPGLTMYECSRIDYEIANTPLNELL